MYTTTEILLEGIEDKNVILEQSTNIYLPVAHYQMIIYSTMRLNELEKIKIFFNRQPQA